jgi:DNA-binding transcriptional LysR family regulator
MTIRHLRVFVEVAETGKMSEAAKRCCISQPTVSQTIRELETYYETLLFERLSKRLYITPAGSQLLIYARRVLSQFDLLESNMKEFCKEEKLRIGATVTVGACLLSSIRNDLKAQHPQLQIYSCVANTRQIEQQLLDSELDVGIVEGTISSPDLIAIPVVDDTLVLAVGMDHPFAHRSQIALSELSSCDFVMREKGSGTRRLFEDYMEQHKIPISVVCEATCLDAIKGAILHNGCISPVSIRLIEREIQAQQIHIIRSGENAWKRSFYLVYHKDKYFSEPMRTLKSVMPGYQCPEFPPDEQVGILNATLRDLRVTGHGVINKNYADNYSV